MVDTNQRLQLQVKASSCSLTNAKHTKPTKIFSAPPGAEAYPLHQPHFLLCLCGSSERNFEVIIFRDGGCVHAWSYARTQRERALAVKRSCGHACGFVVARRFFRAPRSAVWSCVAMTLAFPRCMARSASWPSIKLAGLICNWISMAPSNVAIAIRSRYLAAPKAHRKFWPSPPPTAKSVMLGGGGLTPSAPNRSCYIRRSSSAMCGWL